MNAVTRLVTNDIVKRTPLPVCYEEACRALAEVTTIIGAIKFANLSDALAVWAKIHRDERAEREARALKIESFRAMGKIAEQIRPTKIGNRGGPGGIKSGKFRGGAHSLLKENGLSSTNARAALHAGRIPDVEFNNLISRKKPPSLTEITMTGKGRSKHYTKSGSEVYRNLTALPGGNMNQVRSTLRRMNLESCSLPFELSELKRLLEISTECTEILDCFDRRMAHALNAATKSSKRD